MKNKNLLFIVFGFLFSHVALSDTIYCCNSDTLKAWYWYQGVYFNEQADIKNGDTLIIGANESVYVMFEPASINPEIAMQRKVQDICKTDTFDLVNTIFELTGSGRHFANYESGPYITNFYVIKGEALSSQNSFIIPQDFQEPSYLLEVNDNYQTYEWSTGDNSNFILVDEPESYTVQATNHCQETFEKNFIIEEDGFVEEQFYAGKTTGANIHYIDFEPDSISIINDGGEDEYDFDFNNDGSTDLSIYVSFVSAMSHYANYLVVLPQNGCQVAVYKNPESAQYIQQGQIINQYNAFSNSSPIILSWYYFNPLGSCGMGNWGNDGFVGFAIPSENDTIFGWMHLTYSVEISSSNLVIDSYAYLSESSASLNENRINLFQTYPNPVTDVLRIETSLQTYSIKMLNTSGKIVINKDKISGNNTLDLETLPVGIYFLNLESNTVRHKEKVIKQN